MKRSSYLALLVVSLLLEIPDSGCRKPGQVQQAQLENTIWKLSREEWIYPNGNREFFEKRSYLDGVFIWSFLSNSQLKKRWEPYTVELNGTWNINGNRITTNIFTDPNNPGNILPLHYKLIELTGSFMRVECEEQQTSSINGNASAVYFEFVKQ